MWYTIQYNFVCRYVTESPWISAMYAVIHNYGNPYEKWNIFVARPHLWLQLGMANGPITIATRARFEYDSSTIRLQHATTRYEVFLRARIRDRFEHSTRISGRRVLHVD